nr:MAG TPA: hypothetical protein [Caudoviricetes sp.]
MASDARFLVSIFYACKFAAINIAAVTPVW